MIRASASILGSSGGARVSSLSYTLMSATAKMDTTGRYRVIQLLAPVQDAVAKSVEKPLIDLAFAQDAARKKPTKGLFDEIGFSETFVRTLIFIREKNDVQPVVDAHSFLFEHPVVEELGTTDARLNHLTKAVSDGVAINEGFEAGDGLEYVFTKGISNVAIMLDAATRAVAKSAADTAATGDSGNVVSHNYCDITYFETDYVGTATTF